MSLTSCLPISNISSQVLRCVTFVHLHPTQLQSKLEPRGLSYVFMGYVTTQKGYRCYHPPTQKMFITPDVTFYEKEIYFGSFESSFQGEFRGDEVQTFNYGNK